MTSSLIEKPTRNRGKAGKTRPTAAERAYARRAQRADLLLPKEKAEPKAVKQTAKLRIRLPRPRSRASFVVLMMSLLALGVAATLWLSTQAIAGSYRLEGLRQVNGDLAERTEQLQREVARQESASSLAQRARELGMVPGGDPARIVVNDDGSIAVVGEPKKATAVAPPPVPAEVVAESDNPSTATPVPSAMPPAPPAEVQPSVPAPTMAQEPPALPATPSEQNVPEANASVQSGPALGGQ